MFTKALNKIAEAMVNEAMIATVDFFEIGFDSEGCEEKAYFILLEIRESCRHTHRNPKKTIKAFEEYDKAKYLGTLN